MIAKLDEKNINNKIDSGTKYFRASYRGRDVVGSHVIKESLKLKVAYKTLLNQELTTQVQGLQILRKNFYQANEQSVPA